MRLLNTTSLEPHEFEYGNIPPYAILSHRWGNEEISLQDLEQGVTDKQGFRKVQRCCERAKSDGFAYAWIDTCCINKTSSAELSEAINSMYLWYYQADQCYAYLADVPSKCKLEDSEWFARGWTLQELLAPSEVHFVDEQWNDLGTRTDLQEVISSCTGIPISILSGGDDLESASIAQRMSWAARRKTQRLEDRAYCLMGIFGINMPLLYGEGERAFIRLQEEIMRVSDDQSLFAWKSSDTRGGLLATSPEAFEDSKDVIPFNYFNDPSDPSTLSSRGIHIAVRFIGMGARGLGLAVLQCKSRDEDQRPIGIYVRDQSWVMESFERVLTNDWELLSLSSFRPPQYPRRRLCIRTGRMTPRRRRNNIGEGDYSAQHCFLSSSDRLRLMDLANKESLLRAVQAGYQDEVWLLLTRSDIKLGIEDSDSPTALQHAVISGNEFVVKMLLAQIGQASWFSPMSVALLKTAIGKRHMSIIKLLLDHGASVNPDPGFEDLDAPLLLAARQGRGDVVELLLHRGAQLSVPVRERSLLVALDKRHHEVIKTLLANGDGLDGWPASHHKTPLLYALEHRYDSSFIELLLNKGADVEARNLSDETPLSVASRTGQASVVKLLLARGADIEAKTPDGLTPLSQAVLRGRQDVVEILLDHGAEIETRPTALALAARTGNAKIVGLLLRRGAKMESRDDNGQTPLALAAMCGKDAAVKLLLSQGADISCRDTQGRTPLALAAMCGAEAVVFLLLKHGADLHALDSESRTPLMLARQGSQANHNAVAKLLEYRMRDS